jgi:hypothetical protein
MMRRPAAPGTRRQTRRSGQATVEYVVVGVVLMIIIVVLGLLAGRIGDGLFTEHASRSASHSTQAPTAGAVGDVILY